MEVYYHYTTPESAKAIMGSQVIKKSEKKAKAKRRDAVFGTGVYLTKTPPTMSRRSIALNNYDGLSLAAIEGMIQTGEPMHAAGFRILVVLRNAQTNRNFAPTAHQCRLNFDVVGLFSASYVAIGLGLY